MLPINDFIPQIQDLLNQSKSLVLQAEPGAGKSTAVPLSLLDAPFLNGKKIILLEPRRVAAKSIAFYLASLLGEKVGLRIGYQIRNERKISKNTVLEIVTEGVLTNRLQNDPELADVALIIFDEFHERSIHADLALMLALEVQEAKDAKFHGRTRVNSKKTKKRNDLVVFYSSSDDSDTGDLNEGRNSLAERRASYDTDSDSDDSVPPSSSTGGKGTRIGHKGKEFNRSNEDIFDEINREATEEASSLKAHKGRKSTPSATKQPSSASKGSASSDGRKNEEKASTMDVEANKVNENGKINKKDRKETKEKKEKKKEKTNKRRKK